MTQQRRVLLSIVAIVGYALLAVGSTDTSTTTTGGSVGGSSYDGGSADRITAADFEVVSWNWRKDPSFGTDGAVIYNVEVRNNSGEYIENLRVDFTTYDAQGNIVTTEFSFIDGLSPGGTGATKGYATYYGTEEKARVQLKP